jgi:hypothetical protein
MRIFLGTLFACLVTQADACTIIGGRLLWHDPRPISTTMTVATGKGCMFATASGATGVLQSIRLTRGAKHGTVFLRDGSSPGYRSNPGFTGEDEFIITVCGEDVRGKGCIQVTVRVIVN